MPVAADGGPHVASENSGVTEPRRPTAAPAATASTPPRARCSSKVDEESLCADLPRRGRHGRHHRRRERRPVRASVPADVRGATVGRRPALRRLRRGPDRLRPTRRASRIPRLQGGGVSTMVLQKSGCSPTGGPSPPRTSPSTGRRSSPRASPGATAGSTAASGPAFTTTCTTCHNPHGNGNYRILIPMPVGRHRPARRGAVRPRDRRGAADRPRTRRARATTRSSGAARSRTWSTRPTRAAAPAPPAATTGATTCRGTASRAGTAAACRRPPTGVNGDRPMYVPRAGERQPQRVPRPDHRVVQRLPHALRSGVTGATVRHRRRRLPLPPRRRARASARSATSRTARTPPCPARYSARSPYPDAPGGASHRSPLEPSAQDRQPRHLPGLPRPDAHHRRDNVDHDPDPLIRASPMRPTHSIPATRTMTRPRSNRAGPLFGVLLVVVGAAGRVHADRARGARRSIPRRTRPPTEPAPDPDRRRPSRRRSPRPIPRPSRRRNPTPEPTPDRRPTPRRADRGTAERRRRPTPAPSRPDAVPRRPGASPTRTPSPAPSRSPSAVARAHARARRPRGDACLGRHRRRRPGEVTVAGALDEPLAGAERFTVYRVRFQVVNDGDEAVIVDPALQVGRATAGSPCPRSTRGRRAVLRGLGRRPAVPDAATCDPGRRAAPRRARTRRDRRRGLAERRREPAPGVSSRPTASPRSSSRSAPRWTPPGATATSFRLVRTARSSRGATPRGITMGAKPDVELSPGQKDGRGVKDPVPLYALDPTVGWTDLPTTATAAPAASLGLRCRSPPPGRTPRPHTNYTSPPTHAHRATRPTPRRARCSFGSRRPWPASASPATTAPAPSRTCESDWDQPQPPGERRDDVVVVLAPVLGAYHGPRVRQGRRVRRRPRPARGLRGLPPAPQRRRDQAGQHRRPAGRPPAPSRVRPAYPS